MGPLRNPKREIFAKHVAAGVELAEAYVLAGYDPNSAARRNYNRLARRPDVAARIEALKREREALARAARVPIDQVLTALAARGVDRIDDFFDRNAAGVLTFRADLQSLSVEVSLALLRYLHEGLGIAAGSP
jgi:hypothetical protein